MRSSFRVLVAWVLFLGGAVWAQTLPVISPAQRPEAFRDGDVVACVGDSITHGGRFTEYLMLFYATRFPERKVRIENLGIGGHTAASTLRRLDWDVLPVKATVATIMLGMNDVGITGFGPDKTGAEDKRKQEERFDAYKKNMAELVARIQASGARTILITPSPYDQAAKVERVSYMGANDMLGRCADWLVEFAAAHDCKVVDFHYAMNGVNAAGQAKDPAFTIVGADRVHPGPAGHLVMLYAFLKAQGIEGVVSSVAMNVGDKASVRVENADLADLVLSDGGAGPRFRLTERALPFPVPENAAGALAFVPFVQEMNRQMLTVQGLVAGAYTLSIDGALVGEYTSAQLAAGVNLADNPSTPQRRQAAEALTLADKWFVAAGKIRQLAYGRAMLEGRKVNVADAEALRKAVEAVDADPKAKSHQKASAHAYLDSHDKLDEYVRAAAELQRQVREKCRPVAHEYVILPAKQP